MKYETFSNCRRNPPLTPSPSPRSGERGAHPSRVSLITPLLIAAALLVTGCGPDPNYTVPGLIKTLDHSDPDMRYMAAEKLGKHGPEAKPAVPRLTAALKDDSEMVRFGAAYALAEIGADAEEALPALIESLKSDDVELRLAATYAIPAVGARSPTTAIPALQTAYKDPDPRVRDEAAAGLRKLEALARFQKSP